MNPKPAWACALLTFIACGSARAQAAPPTWDPRQYLAHVSIQATPSTELEVVPAEADSRALPAVARCTEYCEFWAFPGRYTLYTRNHSNGERKDLSLRIKQSSRFRFEAGDDDARAAGLALGIGGSAALVAGFIMITPVIMSSMCEDSNCTTQGERDVATVGVVLMLAGAITTPIGWTMYVRNRTRLKRIDERSYASAESGTQVRVGVVNVGLGGLGVGGMVTF